MNTLTFDPTSLKLLAEPVGPHALLDEPAHGDPLSAVWDEYSFESIRVRAETVTPILEETLHAHLPIHWGINE